VVTPAMFEAQLGPFIEWKKTRGFVTIVGVLAHRKVGTTTASWRPTSTASTRAGRPSGGAELRAVRGDVEQMRPGSSAGRDDRPYCCVEQNVVPDIYYGRFSATTRRSSTRSSRRR